jgi:hypothetical protein
MIQGGLADVGGKVLGDHSDRLNHLSSFLEIFGTHERIEATSPATARLPRDEMHRLRIRTSAFAGTRAIIAALVRICEPLVSD